MWKAMPDAHALRMQEEIERARRAPITRDEMRELADAYGVSVLVVEEIARQNFMDLRGTANALRIVFGVTK